MKKIFLFLYVFSFGFSLSAQEKVNGVFITTPDSSNLIPTELEEIIVIGNPSLNFIKENKALGSLDSYLEESNSINMIRRGAYAWEPMINGMATERSIITIDGMRIFHACTDKMDPITSYVENSNLSKAKVQDGQNGAQFGGTIAGSIDLIRKKTGFSDNKKIGGSASVGFESNNKQQIYAAGLNYTSKKYFADIDFTYRHAENYNAGGKSKQNRTIEFSQFTKYNISATTGFKINAKQEVEGSIIYDRATDVGYPGLTMDVSLAEAIIASLQYRYRNLTKNLFLWETKVYFNTITHVMDDTKRPIVPVRMDMPGWSKTQGFYSKLLGNFRNHSFSTTLSGYRNNSLAEMTMFPNDPNEKDMFMLTWPDVNTIYSGINVDDEILLSPHLILQVQGGIGVNYNKIRSELGLNSLQLFHPELKATKTRVLKNLSTTLSFHHGNFLHQFGIGYGDRAPSVSEAYGFYLLNTNDNYDYVGNPYLKNEKSLNFNYSTMYKIEKFSAKVKVNYFYIMDYIIGKPKLGIPPMNISANGIKIYEQLGQASVFNTSLSMDYAPFEDWTLSADASYRYGQGENNTVLPLIQPFSYRFKIKYLKNNFFAEASIEGSAKNRNSIEFGETQKTSYFIANIALSKNFAIKDKNLAIKIGAQNLFNKYYSTFDDWFGIPRMGRNIYANLIFRL